MTSGVTRQCQILPHVMRKPIAHSTASRPGTSMASTSSLKMRNPRSQSQRGVLNMDPRTISRSVLEVGAEHVVSYGGTSQYNREGAGAAACGLAALNFARIVFLMEQDGLRESILLESVLARECAEEATAICALWSGNLHLEVEDICRIPVFEKTLKLRTTIYGLPGVSLFKTWLTDMCKIDSSAVAIITRPPEILACLKLRLMTRDVFVIFDSHPRPSYPRGAGMIVSTSGEGTARRLTELLPTVDLPDGALQWQAQLLSNCSGHVFVPHGVEMSMPTLWQAVLESSLAQLSMQAEIADLRSQKEFQTSEQQRLESELKVAEERSRWQESLIQRLELSRGNTNDHNPRLPTSPMHSWSSTYQPPTPSSSKASTSAFNNFASSPPAHSQSAGNPSNHNYRLPTPPRHSSSSMSQPSTPSTSKASPHFNNFARASSPSAFSRSAGLRDPPRGPPTPPIDYDGLSYALRLQNEFDAEDRVLTAQRTELAKSTQRLFECGICMEDTPEDSIARPDPCGHPFCRDCLRGHVSARLEEHRFPILCPTCTASTGKGKDTTGEVSQYTALNLGLTDQQYSIWTEMEMTAFSVLLSCRKCQQSMFVARDEHEEAKIIVCPLPGCNHIWCKQCQRTIEIDGPKHSCDGTSELDHLMKQQGWKHCPSTPSPVRCFPKSHIFFCSMQDADPENYRM
ncbi:hypothetical protein BJV78DRAFT_525602 [Lactifluus subvellereus]|nr:hypothetical protein BJV78DRAFT_525602 [Lactifluus subvellereus]